MKSDAVVQHQSSQCTKTNIRNGNAEAETEAAGYRFDKVSGF
jgi:hypothetical protein